MLEEQEQRIDQVYQRAAQKRDHAHRCGSISLCRAMRDESRANRLLRVDKGEADANAYGAGNHAHHEAGKEAAALADILCLTIDCRLAPEARLRNHRDGNKHHDDAEHDDQPASREGPR